MPRRSDAKAGPILSANELRLGKPCFWFVLEVRSATKQSRIGEGGGNSQHFTSNRLQNLQHSELAEEFPLHLDARGPGIWFAVNAAVAGDKRFVYVLKNADRNTDFYVGLSSDVNARLADHNAGRCPHTASRRTWQLHVVIEFSDEERAVRFERYLKSGSGRAFAKRHFEP